MTLLHFPRKSKAGKEKDSTGGGFKSLTTSTSTTNSSNQGMTADSNRRRSITLGSSSPTSPAAHGGNGLNANYLPSRSSSDESRASSESLRTSTTSSAPSSPPVTSSLTLSSHPPQRPAPPEHQESMVQLNRWLRPVPNAQTLPSTGGATVSCLAYGTPRRMLADEDYGPPPAYDTVASSLCRDAGRPVRS